MVLSFTCVHLSGTEIELSFLEKKGTMNSFSVALRDALAERELSCFDPVLVIGQGPPKSSLSSISPPLWPSPASGSGGRLFRMSA